MAIQSFQLDPNAQAYADLAELDPTANTKLTGIAEGAEVNPADLAALDPTASTKLGTVEDNAAADQTGAEVRDLIVALGDTEREIVLTDPTSGQFKVVSIERLADGKLNIKYDDVAV